MEPRILEFYTRPGIYKLDHAYTLHYKFAKISDFPRRCFLAGYQKKQEMRQDENKYLINHRFLIIIQYIIVWILENVYLIMYKILHNVKISVILSLPWQNEVDVVR